MSRSRLTCCKHITCALLVLSLVLVAAEIGLRWTDSRTGHMTKRGSASSELLTNCWLVHHRMKPLQSVTGQHPDSGEPVTFSTNSFGLRGGEVTVPKPAGVFRIVCLGDETTLASEINERQTFCSVLQKLIQEQTTSRVEVINAGVPEYCPLLSYLQYRHSLLSFDADLIVLNFDMTDVADDHRYRRHTRLDDGSAPLACRHPDVRSTEKKTRRPRDRFLLLTCARRKLGWMSTERVSQEDVLDIDSPTGRYAWLTDRPPDWSVYIQQALSPIADLDRLAGKTGARLIVAACPAPWQVSPNASNAVEVRAAAGVPENEIYRTDVPFETLGEFVKSRRVAFCNPVAEFRSAQRPERLFLQNAPRFSAEGHALFAKSLAETILPLITRPSQMRRLPERTAQRQ